MMSRWSRFTLLAIGAAVILVVIAWGAARFRDAAQNRKAVERFTANSHKLPEDAGNNDHVEGAAEQAAQVRNAMAATASELNGDPAKAFRAGERLVASMQAKIAVYEQAYTAFLAAGGLAPSTLQSETAIGERLVLLEKFAAANESYAAFLQGAERTFRDELSRENFPPSQMKETIGGFRDNGNIDTQLAIRGTDTELCAGLRRYLQILRRELGHWKVGPAEEVTFEDPQSAAAFNECKIQMTDVSTRQSDLQKKILQARERVSGRQKPALLESR